VRPTPDGTAFLDRARALLAAHDQAVRFVPDPAVRFAVGLSEHAVGIGLERVLRRVRAALPARAAVEVRTGQSQPLRAAFDAGEIDAAVIRRETGGARYSGPTRLVGVRQMVSGSAPASQCPWPRLYQATRKSSVAPCREATRWMGS